MNADQTLDSVQKVLEVIDALGDGRLSVLGEHQAWANRLLALPRGVTGLVDISSLSNEDLANAKSTAVMLRGFKRQQTKQDESSPLGMQDAQCELFRLFEKLFIGLVGVSSGVVESQEEIRQRLIDRVRSTPEALWPNC